MAPSSKEEVSQPREGKTMNADASASMECKAISGATKNIDGKMRHHGQLFRFNRFSELI